jgi:aryl-alcohol dehydrogenase-like predicted oxidoreductase
MSYFTRRELLKSGLAAGVVAVTGKFSLPAGKQTATDWVTLGKSNVKVTRLALGCGSFSGKVQRDLGQDGFTRLVRYAYDQGIRFFETAESYTEMHKMLGIALKGIPRDTYALMSKVTTFHEGVNPAEKFDELRKLANTEYFDIMLLHWQHTATWPSDSARWQDGILEAQSKKIIIGRGASVHGLPALRQMPANEFLQVAMIRMNHKGKSMDAEAYDTGGPGDVPQVVSNVQQVRKHGMGVISMKLCGEGTFDREDRKAAMRFAFRNAGVDSVTVGYKNTAEIDEAIENLNLALA